MAEQVIAMYERMEVMDLGWQSEETIHIQKSCLPHLQVRVYLYILFLLIVFCTIEYS